MRILVLALCVAGALAAQTAETAVFRARMLPSNEVPAVDIAASGIATIRAHYVRDANGQVGSGTVDFSISYNFPAAPVTFTGLHIHRGAAGENGPVRIDSGLSGSNTLDTQGGRGAIDRQAQVTGANADSLATLRDMLTNPAGFYVNLHTTVNPGGVIRGQLERAEELVLFGQMSPANEVPPITGLNASGLATITVLRSFSSNGAVSTGNVTFDVTQSFPSAVTFTGLHIHNGAAGANGPVIINSGISGTSPVDSTASPRINIPVEVDVTNANQLATLNGLFVNPAGYYVNLHTTINPGGVIRAQLRSTDRMRFQFVMSPANEVPPLNDVQGQAVGFVEVNAIRDASGAIEAAKVTFDSNVRFPSRTEFTGFHIHDAAAGANGPVIINTGLAAAPNSVVLETGFGNITRSLTVSSGAALATLNDMVSHPELHYVNLHTTTNPGGVVRAQTGPGAAATPFAAAVVSAVLSTQLTAVARGGLFTVFGTNLARFPATLSANETGVLPTSLNGVSVSVAGTRVPLLFVSPTQINAQMPANAGLGSQSVVVTTGDGTSAPANVTVAETAPAIFFSPSGGAVLKNSDFSLVSGNNPAAAGDILVIYATGLGQTTPPLDTGRTAGVPPPLLTTAPVTVTIGGRDAEVLYSIASPGFAGLYQVAVRMPAGVTPSAEGRAPVVLREGAVNSNSVDIAVR